MWIYMQEDISPSGIDFPEIELAFVSKDVDERGEAAIKVLKDKGAEIVVLSYNSDDYELNINGDCINVDDAYSVLKKYVNKKIIIEATTLGFAEIFILLRAFYELKKTDVCILYVEPGEYFNSRRTQVLHKRDFELSDEIPGYNTIPGATYMMSDKNSQKCVFLLGFEDRRLERAFEDYSMLSPSKCPVVFGVPAYVAGWEMNSFANNVRVLRDKSISGGVYYCGAENPLSAYEVVNDVYRSCKNERLFVAPLGTKPNAIGAALFLAMNDDVGVLYDHPKRKKGGSESIGRWHMYRVYF